jgi:hypothetical protein
MDAMAVQLAPSIVSRAATRLWALARPSARTIRLVVVAILLIGTAIGYVMMLRQFRVSEVPLERRFGATAAGEAQIAIYVEAIGIDPLNQAMRLRVSIAPRGALRGTQAIARTHDLALAIEHGDTTEHIEIPANQPMPSTSFDVDLEAGNVTAYPLDRYRTDLRLQCFEKGSTAAGNAKRLPAEVTAWEGLLGFRLQTAEQPGSRPDDIRVTFETSRGGAFAFFAFAAYGAMVVIACGALAIGVLAFLRLRRAESTLVGALAAVVFALPILRNALPGAPPLGVLADMLVFLWAELAAVIALGLVIFTWARTGPRP